MGEPMSTVAASSLRYPSSLEVYTFMVDCDSLFMAPGCVNLRSQLKSGRLMSWSASVIPRLTSNDTIRNPISQSGSTTILKSDFLHSKGDECRI